MADIARGKELLTELKKIIESLDDSEIPLLLSHDEIRSLLISILNVPAPVYLSKEEIFPMLLKYKHRGQVIALLRAMATGASIQVDFEGGEGYISPSPHQWYDDGVMFNDGRHPFSGLAGLYREGKLSYAIITRDVKKGEELTKNDFKFIPIEDLRKVFKTSPGIQNSPDLVLENLQKLLLNENNDEKEYQRFFESHPWILGFDYTSIESHISLDDENVPDYTGIRTHDNFRDIFEIKPPFLKLFQSDGEFRSEFHDALSQTKRYLDFAERQRQYLKDKHLNFENPKGILIIGYNLSEQQMEKIYQEMRQSPKIQIYTYNQVMNKATNAIEIIKMISPIKKLSQ